MKEKISTIMFILTDACNLKCCYCYEKSRYKTMTFETAKDILDRHLAQTANGREIRIEFFGGEVLLQFPLLVQIYEYIQEYYPKQKIRYAITTNGTLMHGEIQEWFRIHREEFDCTLSLDGTVRMHNDNRRQKNGQGSYEIIDLDFFRKNWPCCIAKMTVSEKTLPELEKGIREIEAKGFWCKATFASGIDWNMDEAKRLLVREYEKLIEYYSGNNQYLCMLFDLDLRAVFSPCDASFRYCDAGDTKVCYDTDGRVYPCQGLAGTALGEQDAALFEGKCFENFMMSADNPCYACKWRRVCRVCYASNYLETGSIERSNKNTCYLNRMTIMASSAIQYKRILRSKEKTLQQKQTVMAIAKIQESILTEYGMREV